jgi:hypothetical protein
MDKFKINMIGGGFQHSHGTNAYNIPKLVEWIKREHSAQISIHIDNGIYLPVDNKKINFAMLSESKTIIPSVYQAVVNNIKDLENKFELIFTHDVSMENLSSKIRIINPPASSWILESERKIYKKTKLISMIASTKNFCKEHNYRILIADKYSDQLDLFGRGRKTQLQNKIDGLKDYYFSICMENSLYENCFTEKIVDCFATGTIPIYHGPEAVYKIFNPNGIIRLQDFNISNLSAELYNKKFEAVKENFEIATNFLQPEDEIYLKFIKGRNDIL